ncbi:syntaphilin isoform X2 [Salmo trutta]|uniref:Syntaphilin n=1 Tax=Salmo trutta TaxID=8032 RepID=A0A673XXJ4_SALTR|nr:syntaphilin-like isoform X2 [Salmo trutta]XP_029578798.1 syntaphilin-like isoform X2 [Salmo trutta]XP_029578800.1 syntaphilin-like isoform X2 [Salmo trutta]
MAMNSQNALCLSCPSLSHLPSFPLGASSRWSTPMSLPQSRKPSAGQRRRPVATSSGCHSYIDASNTNTYPGRASEGSPTARTYPGTPKHQVKHATCSDNHGIRPPTPEQYLTPLQQKEVCIRHLRARLRENIQRLQHRDSEIAEMKTQLCRMQEDWIVEECHRVEAQLALKQARREIQHLHEVVETVRSNLGTPEKAPYDKKPYLSPQRPRPAKSRSCGCSPASTLSRSTAYTRLSSEALYVDRNGNAPEPDLRAAAQVERGRTHLLLEAALLSEQQTPSGPALVHGPSSSTMPRSSTYERLCSGGAVLPVSHSCHSLSNSCRCSGHTYLPHHHLFLHLPQEEPPAAVAAAAAIPVREAKPEVRSQACSPTMTWVSEEGGGEELSIISLATTNITPAYSEQQLFPPSLSSSSPPQPFPPSLSFSPSPQLSYNLEPLSSDGHVEMTMMPTVAQTCQPKPGPMLSPERQGGVTGVEDEEKGEAVEAVEVDGENVVGGEEGEDGAPQRNFWSRYFLVDLLAVAMPVVPTVAWLCHGAPREVMPVYHIGSLLRGCCAVALHSLRRGGRGRGPTSMNGATNI